MQPVGREGIRHDDGIGRVVQPGLDTIIAEDPVDLGHIEVAAAQRDSVRNVQALAELHDLVGPAVRIPVPDGVDPRAYPAPLLQLLRPRPRADEERSGLREHHRSGVLEPLGVHLDPETRRETQPVQGQRLLRRRAAGDQEDAEA